MEFLSCYTAEGQVLGILPGANLGISAGSILQKV
jgi:hypothetical protein